MFTNSWALANSLKHIYGEQFAIDDILHECVRNIPWSMKDIHNVLTTVNIYTIIYTMIGFPLTHT